MGVLDILKYIFLTVVILFILAGIGVGIYILVKPGPAPGPTPVMCLYSPIGCNYTNKCMMYKNNCTNVTRCVVDETCNKTVIYNWPQGINGTLQNSSTGDYIAWIIDASGNLGMVPKDYKSRIPILPLFMQGTNIITKLQAQGFAYWSNNNGRVIFDNDPEFPILNLYYNTQTGQLVDNLLSPKTMISLDKNKQLVIVPYASVSAPSVWLFKPS